MPSLLRFIYLMPLRAFHFIFHDAIFHYFSMIDFSLFRFSLAAICYADAYVIIHAYFTLFFDYVI